MRKRSQRAKTLSRRRFMQAGAAGVAAGISASTRVWGSSGDAYSSGGGDGYAGKCLVTLQLTGGADVTQLCDPKVNTPGELKINNWADRADPGQVGNIVYAPVADNEWFFNRFGADMLVVNGVDAQTNSHETGVLYNWTGSNAEGKPSLTALHAAYNSPDQPLAYAVFGGESRTSGIIGYNRFDDLRRLSELAQPRMKEWQMHNDEGEHTETHFVLQRPQMEYDRVDRLVSEEMVHLLADPHLSPRQLQHLEQFTAARTSRDALKRLADILPSGDDVQGYNQILVDDEWWGDNLKQQMQGALLVFKSGLGSAADISFGGFDSHENHDAVHESLYFHLADSVGYFWDYAEALGLADRLMLVIGSDFGRTNFYNDGQGKDHWPIGSYMIMEKNAPWGNRVVGQTDALHFAQRVDPRTLKESRDGVLITPAHVHQAVQEYLGLDGYAHDLGLGLRDTVSLPLFDPSLQTGASA